ncbi:hypothetical protein HF086_012942 [Spodoptera exigua]|uniref:Uncharacterized protein n=1 Tax=Spodoptera exigua TaxID=7107 RepID=A0A922SI78_SPOEX|nr:hypothetical protein HF086_012942 [Spodoptera exigua]
MTNKIEVNNMRNDKDKIRMVYINDAAIHRYIHIIDNPHNGFGPKYSNLHCVVEPHWGFISRNNGSMGDQRGGTGDSGL